MIGCNVLVVCTKLMDRRAKVYILTTPHSKLGIALSLARSNKFAFSPCVGLPATAQCLASVLRRELSHSRLQLGSEVADEALDGPGEGLAESYGTISRCWVRRASGLLTANGVALNLLCELLEHVNLALTALALLESAHDLLGPLASLTARSALSARFVAVEVT